MLAGLGLAWYYPNAQPLPVVVFALWAFLSYYRPATSLVAIPMILPLIGFYPWTGWLTFEEFDLLVLAFFAGAYVRMAQGGKLSMGVGARWGLIVVTLMLVSVAISAWRGIADAGGFVFGWFQGYEGPMNSFRVAKSFLWAGCAAPVLLWLDQRNPGRASRLIAVGMAVGCFLVALVTFWERLVFPGLFDFSTDYRTTGPFWEMHVGGAALDGWLLLTAPFLIWMALSAKDKIEVAVVTVLIAVALYAALTTFSRGVYLGLGVSLSSLALLLRHRFRRSLDLGEGKHWGMGKQVTLLAILGVLTAAAFTLAGYRGMLALLGSVPIALGLPTIAEVVKRERLAWSLLIGVGGGAVLIGVASLLPKGPYWIYVAIWCACFVMQHPRFAKFTSGARQYAVAGLIMLLFAAANVAGYWAGPQALSGFAGIVTAVGLIAVGAALSRFPVWPLDWRWQVGVLLQVVLLSGVLAIFLGGGYLSDRFTTVGRDWTGRLAHWTHSMTLLRQGDELLFGKGIGRFPANYYFAEPNGNFPGAYRLVQNDEGAVLLVVGAKHPMSFGDILRISQRIDAGEPGPFTVDMKVRAQSDVGIHVEVCDKHLLYPSACVIGEVGLKATVGDWISLQIPFDKNLLPDHSFWLPTFRTFSVGVTNPSGRAEIDNIGLMTLDGTNVLKNADFSNDLAHWFFSSDHDHMPWHAKNILINVIFDQGVLGVSLFLLMTAVAMGKVIQGVRCGNELAPYWLASMLGFMAVGLFDSLIDVPRLAFMYYLLIVSILICRMPGRQRGYKME